MKKNLVAWLLVSTMLLTLLAGCGGSPATNTPSVAPSAKSEAKDDNSATNETETAIGDISGTIKFACWDYDLYGYDKNLVEGFSAKYPDVNVEVLDIPNADFPDKINIMLSGGETLDVLYAKNITVYGNLLVKNQAEDVAPYIERDNLDLSHYGAAINSFLKDDAGHIYGLPYRSDRYYLYYNKDIFDAAGVEYPSDNMTWEDMRTLAKKLTSGEGQSKIYGAFFVPGGFGFSTSGIQEGKGDLGNMDVELFRDGWQNIYDMIFTDKSAQDWAALKSISADQTYFMNGSTAMTVNGGWFMNTMKSEIEKGRAKINYGVQRVPVSNSMKAVGTHSSNASFTPVCMTSSSKNKEAAWEFVKYICSEEGASILASYLINPGYMSEAVIDTMAKDPTFDPSAKDAMLNTKVGYPIVSGSNLNAGELNTMFYQELENLFTGNSTVDDSIAFVKKERDSIQNK